MKKTIALLMLLCLSVMGAEAVSSSGMANMSGMRELAANDIALELDGLSLNRDELLVLLQKRNPVPPQKEMFSGIVPLVNGLTPAQQQSFRRSLYHLVQQQLLLRAAKGDGMMITEADRQHFYEMWKEENPERDMVEYLGQFPVKATEPLELSRDDMFLIFKWTERQLEQVSVPEELVRQSLMQMKQITETFGRQAEEERKNFTELAKNADLYTDEGFARLAREISDGIESDRGGVIDEPMTRSEIAAANFGQPFTTPVGETSSMIETPTSLRYIRVLGELPAEMPGAPVKLRIAQILYGKRAMDDLPTEEQIRADLKYQFHQRAIQVLLQEKLAEKFHFKCPIIPDLLDWQKATQDFREENRE